MPCTNCPPAPPLPVGPPVPPTPPAGPFPRAHQKTVWRCANGLWVPQTNQCVDVLGQNACDGRTGILYTPNACADLLSAPPAAPAGPGCGVGCGAPPDDTMVAAWVYRSTWDCSPGYWGTVTRDPAAVMVARSSLNAWIDATTRYTYQYRELSASAPTTTGLPAPSGFSCPAYMGNGCFASMSTPFVLLRQDTFAQAPWTVGVSVRKVTPGVSPVTSDGYYGSTRAKILGSCASASYGNNAPFSFNYPIPAFNPATFQDYFDGTLDVGWQQTNTTNLFTKKLLFNGAVANYSLTAWLTAFDMTTNPAAISPATALDSLVLDRENFGQPMLLTLQDGNTVKQQWSITPTGSSTTKWQIGLWWDWNLGIVQIGVDEDTYFNWMP